MNNCQDMYCHVYWVQDSNHSDHYVCLKCGKERWISGHPAKGFFVFFIIAGIAAFMTLVTSYKDNRDSRKTLISFNENQPTLNYACRQCRDENGNNICCPE